MSHQGDTAGQNANITLDFVREHTSGRCREVFTAFAQCTNQCYLEYQYQDQ